MKLTVNGVDVPIADRLDIVLESPPEGGELPGGIRVEFQGGLLTVRHPTGPAFEVFGERQTTIKGGPQDESDAVIHWGPSLQPFSFQADPPMGIHPPSRDVSGQEYTLCLPGKAVDALQVRTRP